MPAARSAIKAAVASVIRISSTQRSGWKNKTVKSTTVMHPITGETTGRRDNQSRGPLTCSEVDGTDSDGAESEMEDGGTAVGSVGIVCSDSLATASG